MATPTNLGAELMLAALLPSGTTRYLALYTDNGATVEMVDANYARQPISAWTQVGLVRQNTNLVEWAGAATTSSISVYRVGVLDALVGGNLLAHAKLNHSSFPVVLSTTDFIRFPAGDLKFTAQAVA